MSSIFSSAARTIQLLCNALSSPIVLDAPRFEEQYVSFDLKDSHAISADFFIRAQSVGFTVKGEDLPLFYLLQDMVKTKALTFEVPHCGFRRQFEPHLAGNGQFSMANPCTFYLAGIASGNLKGWSDLPVSRDESTFEMRADFLANLLWTQWIVKIMPIVEQYKLYKRNHLLASIK